MHSIVIYKILQDGFGTFSKAVVTLFAFVTTIQARPSQFSQLLSCPTDSRSATDSLVFVGVEANAQTGNTHPLFTLPHHAASVTSRLSPRMDIPHACM
jgi:hypothetical protein